MRRLFTKRVIIIALVILASIFMVVYFETKPRPRLAPGQKPLTDIKKIDPLRTQFNLDAGKTRLIILVSPTRVECLAGARWVQNQLSQYSSDNLRVYAVWIPMLGGDSRDD